MANDHGLSVNSGLPGNNTERVCGCGLWVSAWCLSITERLGHYRTPNYPHCWSFYITITIIVLKEGQPLSMTGLFVTLWWWFIPDNGLSNIVPHKPNQALLRLIRHRHIHTLTHKHRTNNGLFMRLREMWFVDWAMCCFCPLNHPPPPVCDDYRAATVLCAPLHICTQQDRFVCDH